jgi:hypothetical protein
MEQKESILEKSTIEGNNELVLAPAGHIIRGAKLQLSPKPKRPLWSNYKDCFIRLEGSTPPLFLDASLKSQEVVQLWTLNKYVTIKKYRNRIEDHL